MASADIDHDAIIIGAGVCGIYQLHRMLEMGLDVRVFEAGSGPGGTWYWNRYPGARFDSESWTYGFSFSRELVDEWEWSEQFAAQPETLRYLEHVVERFGLRPHMSFDSKVESATWDESTRTWTVIIEGGGTHTCRILMTALGLLSAPTMPRIDGIDSFEGPSFHTSDWPHDQVDLAGKRVGIIGTGATGVQVIGAIADTVGSLTVFQRHPNWCAPLHNKPITSDEHAHIRETYTEIMARCDETPGGFIWGPDPRSYHDLTPEERLEFWEELYDSPGFRIWLGNFREVLMEDGPNDDFSAFVADKIRARVHDPAVAEKLIPTDHGFGMRRVPMETGYYEAYNRDNVHLVDLNETPIEEIVPTGIRTTAETHDLDVIIYATGFDAITGAFDRIDFIGTGGLRLRDKWAEGPISYLGLAVHGFPNLITIAGPTSASITTNFPRGIETAVDWTSALVEHLRTNDVTRFEATPEAEREWTDHVRDLYGFLLLRKAKSWLTGYNSNLDGREQTRYVVYNGGAPRYRSRLRDVEESGYAGFVLD